MKLVDDICYQQILLKILKFFLSDITFEWNEREIYFIYTFPIISLY